MLMQNVGVTNKVHYSMLWYFLDGSITASEERRERTRAVFPRPSHSRHLSRAALATLATPPNGELPLRLGLSYCVAN